MLYVFVVFVLGVVIELVESQDRKAAAILAVILLLGVATFNASAFQRGINETIFQLQGGVAYRVPKKQTVGKGRN